MRLLHVCLFSLLLGVSVLAPNVAFAADAKFFGPVISKECECPESAPDWGCVLQTVQNVVNLGISLGVIFAVVVIAWAGMLYMTSSVNVQNREQAKTMLTHAVVGLLIALSAWLLVDFVMKILYNPNTQGSGVQFGPWNTILADNDSEMCLKKREPPQGTTSSQQGTGQQQDGGVTATNPTPTQTSTGDGSLPFPISGIQQQQTSDVSSSLQSFLQCIRSKPGTANAAISSISDDWLYTRNKTFEDCRGGECQHCGGTGSNSCSVGGSSYHYGGTRCSEESYAADFTADYGTTESNALIQAAQQCGGRSYRESGDHTHVQIGSCN